MWIYILLPILHFRSGLSYLLAGILEHSGQQPFQALAHQWQGGFYCTYAGTRQLRTVPTPLLFSPAPLLPSWATVTASSWRRATLHPCCCLFCETSGRWGVGVQRGGRNGSSSVDTTPVHLLTGWMLHPCYSQGEVKAREKKHQQHRHNWKLPSPGTASCLLALVQAQAQEKPSGSVGQIQWLHRPDQPMDCMLLTPALEVSMLKLVQSSSCTVNSHSSVLVTSFSMYASSENECKRDINECHL